ncbi:MAG: SNF2-related protein [Anaerolineales bacterium]
METRLPIELPVGELAAVQVFAPPVSTLAPRAIERALSMMMAGRVAGKRLVYPRITAAGTRPLPIGEGCDGATILSRIEASWDEIDLLRPCLEPPASTGELIVVGASGQLRQYQRQAAQALMASPWMFLADDPGSGKTVASVVALNTLVRRGTVLRALVLCGEGGLRHWACHFAMWSPGLLVKTVHGDQEQRAAKWREPSHVYLTDYKALDEDQASGNIDHRTTAFDLIVFDDVQSALHTSDHALRLLQSMKAPKRWWLGSMPAQEKDRISLINLVNPGSASAEGRIELREGKSRPRPHILHRSKSELRGEMPHWVFQEVWVDLGAAQHAEYLSALQEERNKLDKLASSATGKHIRAALAHLNLISTFEAGGCDGPKVRALINLVEQITDSRHRLVVLAMDLVSQAQKLMEVLGDYGTIYLDPGQSETQRRQALEAFCRAREKRVLLCEPTALTPKDSLAHVSYFVSFDPPMGPDLRQAFARVLQGRDSSAEPVVVYQLWVAGTHQARAHKLLRPQPQPARGTAPELPPKWMAGLPLEDWLRAIVETSDQAQQIEQLSPM